MTTQLARRVFISHRGADAALAAKLADELRQAGHDVRLDVWDLNLGDSIVAFMNDALADARSVVVCYSAAGVLAPWMSREWMAALALQLNGHGVKLLPVRLSGGEPPAILADLKYADLVQDWDGGLRELLRALR